MPVVDAQSTNSQNWNLLSLSQFIDFYNSGQNTELVDCFLAGKTGSARNNYY
jgi:hypothetical protein